MFQSLMQAGWLGDFTNWLKHQIAAVWQAFVDFVGDQFVKLVHTILELIDTIILAIPTPDFLLAYSLDSLLGSAGPTIAWLVSSMRLGSVLTLIAAATVFRLVRKVLTLFQW